MKVYCLGHLSCVHNDHNFFLFGCSQQDYLNYPKLVHIPIKGQMVLGPPTSLLECKFYNSLPFIISNLLCFPNIPIHFKNNDSPWCASPPITYGKCREAIEETKMLIEDEVNQKSMQKH